MAEQLVETMTEAFDPSKYKDEYREALLKVIEAKVEGVEIATPEPVEESANLVDLMKLLEASVKAATDSKTAGATEPVNVADAKEARAKRPAAKKATAKPAAAEADDAESARPARRRKSA
jgi:DNA end-binding protein Ku